MAATSLEAAYGTIPVGTRAQWGTAPIVCEIEVADRPVAGVHHTYSPGNDYSNVADIHRLICGM